MASQGQMQLRSVQVGFQDQDGPPKTDAEKLQKCNQHVAQMQKRLQQRWVSAGNTKSQSVEPYLEAIGSPFAELHHSPSARERAFRANQMRSPGRLLRKSLASQSRHRQCSGLKSAAFEGLLTTSQISAHGGGDARADLTAVGDSAATDSLTIGVPIILGSEMVTDNVNTEASFSDPLALTEIRDAGQRIRGDDGIHGTVPSTLIMAVAPAMPVSNSTTAAARPADANGDRHGNGCHNGDGDAGTNARPSSPATVQLVMATPQSLAQASYSSTWLERPHTSHGCGHSDGYDMSSVNPYTDGFHSPRLAGSANLLGKFPQRVPVVFGSNHLPDQHYASATPTQAMRARQRVAQQQVSWARHSATRNRHESWVR